AVVGGLQHHPGPLADRVADELDVAVAEGRVDAARVPAAGLAGHVEVVRPSLAAHAVAGADARVPEAVTALHLVGLLQPVVRRRVAVAAGTDHARPRHAQSPSAPQVFAV